MEEKKYELSLSDIQMLIGLGVNAVCVENDLHGIESDYAVYVVANTYRKVRDHLTGKCEFTKKDIATYNLAQCLAKNFAAQKEENNHSI